MRVCASHGLCESGVQCPCLLAQANTSALPLNFSQGVNAAIPDIISEIESVRGLYAIKARTCCLFNLGACMGGVRLTLRSSWQGHDDPPCRPIELRGAAFA